MQSIHSKYMEIFSFFPAPISNVKPSLHINIKQLYELIISDKYTALINQIREVKDPKKKANLKKQLDYVILSGTFNKRSNDGIINYSGLFCVDIDNVKKPEELRKNIFSELKPVLCFLSPNRGLKVIYRIDLQQAKYNDYFLALEQYFLQVFNIQIDKKCKDVSRACFLSYDPEAVLNEDAPRLDKAFIDTFYQEQKEIEPCHSNKIKLSSTKKIEFLEKWLNRNMSFIRGNRNQYITQLSGACNRFGISEIETLNHCLQYAQSDFTEKEIRSTVQSIYRNTSYFGIANFDPKVPYEFKESEKIPYIRVGDVYYKTFRTYDKNGSSHVTLEKRSRQTLIDDHGKDFLKKTPKYDTFVNIPLNIDYKQVIGLCWNLYQRIEFEPQKGNFQTIEKLIKHVFAEQYEYGLDYLQLLFLKPVQKLPVLCLVSIENQTGKTTFALFLNMLFGANTAIISSTEFSSEFNSIYATKLIVALEENKMQDTKLIDKLKNLSTADAVPLRKMHREHQQIDFFAKFILLSNHEKSFLTINENDIRYWVRKLAQIKDFDPKFETKLKSEIPAFLYFLKNRTLKAKYESRMYFSPEIIKTNALELVRKESRSFVANELICALTDIMNDNNFENIEATASDIKHNIFNSNSKVGRIDIMRALKDELEIFPTKKTVRYKDMNGVGRYGKTYCFTDELLNRLK